MRRNTRKGIGKRIVSGLLALTLMVTSVNMPINKKEAKAATQYDVSLDRVSNTKTIKYGGKAKRGTMYKMNINGKEGFCMNLGQRCHSSDKYSVRTENKEYNTESTDKKSEWLAKIGAWYKDSKTVSSIKRWKYAQALIWGVTEGKTSKTSLENILKQIVDTGDSASAIMNEMDAIKNTKVKYTIYKNDTASSGQDILVIDNDTKIQPTWRSYSTHADRVQRLRIVKKDNKGNPIEGVKFQIGFENLTDVTRISIVDKKALTDSDTENDYYGFDWDGNYSWKYEGETTKDGIIEIELYIYNYVSESYGYSNDTDKLTADQKKTIKAEMEDAGVIPTANLTYSEAISEASEDATNSIEDNYAEVYITEQGKKGYLADPKYDGTIVYDSDEDAVYPEYNSDEGDGYITLEDAMEDPMAVGVPGHESPIAQADVVNQPAEISVGIKKVDPYNNPSANAAFQLYWDSNCNTEAKNIDGNSQTITTDNNGQGTITCR